MNCNLAICYTLGLLELNGLCALRACTTWCLLRIMLKKRAFIQEPNMSLFIHLGREFIGICIDCLVLGSGHSLISKTLLVIVNSKVLLILL